MSLWTRLWRYIQNIDRDESSTDWNAFLSTTIEYHAVAIGYLVGVSGSRELVMLFALYIMGTGAYKFRNDSHIRDAALEPAYAAFGVSLGLFQHYLLWGAPAWL